MAFTPNLSACFKNNCGTISSTDITGAYSSNSTGWGSPNPTTASITAASLVITSPGGTVTTVNVLSQLPESYSANFNFTDIDITPEDGLWTILYTLSVGETNYTFTYCTYITCSVRCCIDKMWCKWLDSLDAEDNCKCGCKDSEQIHDKVIFMESLYKMLKNCACSRTTAQRDKTLKQLQRLCNLENCNC